MGEVIPRPSGRIRKVAASGQAYLPLNVQRELGVESETKADIPLYMDGNLVLLVRRGTTLERILRGLEVLKEDLVLRAEETESQLAV